MEKIEQINYDAIKELPTEDKLRVLTNKINEVVREINQGALWDRKVESDRNTSQNRADIEYIAAMTGVEA